MPTYGRNTGLEYSSSGYNLGCSRCFATRLCRSPRIGYSCWDPTELLEEVKIFPVQQEAPTDSLEKVLILFRSRGPQLTLFRKCPFSFTHAGSQLTLSRLCSFFSTLQVKTDLKPRTQSEKLIIFVTNRQTDT